MIDRLITFILNRRGWLIAAIVLIIILLVPGFTRVEIGSTYAQVFPPKSDPERIFLDSVYDDFGNDNNIIIAITHDDVFSISTLKKIQGLTEQLEDLPAVEYVKSLTNANIIKSDNGELHLQNISDEIPTTEAAVEQFRKDILGNSLYANNLVSGDNKTTIVNAIIDLSYPDEEVRFAVEEAQRLARLVEGPEQIHVVGQQAMSYEIFRLMSSDLVTYLPFSLLIIGVILLLNFRSGWIVLMTLVAVAVALMSTYSIMAMLDIPIFILTAALPPIITALGVSYAIHLFTMYSRQRVDVAPRGQVLKKTLRHILLAILLSAVTTAIGFASLMLVNIVAIRRMGAFLTVGLLFMISMVAFFIPPLLMYVFPRVRQRRHQWASDVGHPLAQFAGVCVRRRILILLIALGLGAISVVGLTRLNIETDIHQFFRERSPFRQALDIIAERLHGTTPINIVLEASGKMGVEDPALLKSIEQLQERLDAHPTVGKTVSVADYIKIINKALHDDDPAYYVIPDTRDEVAQYLLAYSLADTQRTLDHYIDFERKRTNIAVRSSLTSSMAVLDFRDYIEDCCEPIFSSGVTWKVTSDSVLMSITARHIAEGILISFILAAAIISLIMVFLFRSIKMGLIAMIPNILPMLLILGLMGWVGIDFNIGTCIVVCLAIGIAVDDTIHFLVRYFYELKLTNHYLIRELTGVRITSGQRLAIATTMRHVGRPIILTSIAICFGFGVLAFSQFVPVASFGILAAITMIYCLLCDLVLLPALLASTSI